MHCRKVALIGIGLLGGSIGLAVKQRRLAGHVAGYVRRSASATECQQLGLVDEVSMDLKLVVDGADVVIFCTPIAQMAELASSLAPWLKAGAVVTDVGSVKSSVVETLAPIIHPAGAWFVGSHPMAGAEQTGPKAAKADLFENAICVTTPAATTDRDALQRVEAFWEAIGMRIMRLSPERHDDLVGRSSHLPHVVAAELANYVLSPALPKEQALLCASGFRDSTRIASGSPEMWRDIAMANRENLARVLGVFIEDLQEFQLALEKGDTKAIETFFQSAKRRRDDWFAAWQRARSGLASAAGSE